MGLILNPSVIITGEREGKTVRPILEQFRMGYGETEIGLSVASVVELTHGIQPAKLEERRQRRFERPMPAVLPARPANRPRATMRVPENR